MGQRRRSLKLRMLLQRNGVWTYGRVCPKDVRLRAH
jgi:hypothetical protein